jgi:hypothetical protein
VMAGPPRYVEYQGKTWRMHELAKHLDLAVSTLTQRVDKGFPLDVDQRCKRKVTERRNGVKATAHPLYLTWKAMRYRCQDPDAPKYKDYGGRGIRVCDRWNNSFWDFVDDVGPKPLPSHTLDRYPNADGHYEPGNVRWASCREQRLTQRKARLKRAPEARCVCITCGHSHAPVTPLADFGVPGGGEG